MPKLRFPEFREAGEWEEKRLGDVGSVRMCKRIFKEQTSPRGDIPFYKIGTFGGAPDAYISRELFESFRNNFPFPKNGAVLISAAGTIGRTVRYKGELVYFQDSNIVWLDNSEDLIADNFLYYLYQLVDWSPSVGAIQRLYNANILGAQVKFPSIPEQQKIADCITSLDELITLEAQKLDTLKTHKKGLMQQLFPAEGETLPKLRFPEFRDSGEWEELPIGGKVHLLSGYPFDGADITEAVSGTPLMRGINITEGFVRHSRDIDRYFLGDAKNLDKYRLRIDDLVIGMDGSKVGKNSALISESDVDALLVQRVARLRAKHGAIIQFISQQINCRKFHAYVDRINTSSGIPHISAKQINDFKICFPSVVGEQQKIADCLASIDDLITAQTQKLAALKTHKKGLMQQLFPALDEGPE